MLNYVEFRDQWEKQHPASVPSRKRVMLPYPVWLQYAVLAMFVSAVLLSAVHTIPIMYEAIPITDVISEVVRRAAAHAAVFVIELSLFIAVYASATSKSNTYIIIEIVAFVGALAANLDSVLSVTGSDIGSVIVGVIVGSLPPLVAALSGAVYVRMHRANARAVEEAEAQYREDMKAHDTVVLSAFRKYEKEMSGGRLSGQTGASDGRLLSASGLSDQTADRQTTLPAASGFNRTPDGQRKVIEWLDERPEDAALSSAKLMERMKASGVTLARDTVWRGQNAWKSARAEQPQVSANGTGAE